MNRWYESTFNKDIVRCKNYKCKTEFIRYKVKSMKECPICQLPNSGKFKLIIE